jgi:hypothetical protein
MSRPGVSLEMIDGKRLIEFWFEVKEGSAHITYMPDGYVKFALIWSEPEWGEQVQKSEAVIEDGWYSYWDYVLGLNSYEISLKYKDTATLTASEHVTWQSDNAAVMVDQNGMVTSVKRPFRTTATISATRPGDECTVTCIVTVKPSFWQWFKIIALFGWIWM